MDGHANLSKNQLLMITYILSSSSVDEACKKVKISRTTYYSWLKDNEFKDELKRVRDELIEESLNSLKYSITKATEELIKLADSEREDIKRLACRDIITFGLKAIEVEDIEKRLDKIEEVILRKNNKCTQGWRGSHEGF